MTGSLAARRITRQHERGNHTECDRRTCDWWQKPQWVREAQERQLRAKELIR